MRVAVGVSGRYTKLEATRNLLDFAPSSFFIGDGYGDGDVLRVRARQPE